MLQKYFQLKHNGNSKSFHTIMQLKYNEGKKKQKRKQR